MAANRIYKNSVFSLLFNDPETLRELYGALEGVSLPPDLPVTINTLEGVLFMERVNDLSFEVGDKLVVVLEHQSTVNPNMPLRCLLYLARLYEKITGSREIYKSRLVRIPRPECFVLYNGKAAYPDEEVLKLSEAFAEAKDPGRGEAWGVDLELSVKVININKGHNEEKMRRSKKLDGYSIFIAKVREYEAETGDREGAVKGAVKYCIEHDILADFLRKNGSEVSNMLYTEWNWDDALAVRYEEGREEGREQGREEGREQGWEEGREEIARNALVRGIPIETVSEITGLDVETISRIR